MGIDTRELGDGSVTISVVGELDLATAPRLRDLLLQAVEANARRQTTIDLAGCTFMDSSGLCAIVEAGRVLDPALQLLQIANLHGQPAQLFALTMADRAPFMHVLAETPLGSTYPS